MKLQVQRIAALLIAGLVVYKITVAAFANKIPGQPFYGFGTREWFTWIVDPSEFAFVFGTLIVEYGSLYFLTRRLSIATLAVWSGLLGAYVACLLFPFDLLSTVDNLPDGYWPPGLIGVTLEVVLFFGIIPSVLALALMRFHRLPKHEITA